MTNKERDTLHKNTVGTGITSPSKGYYTVSKDNIPRPNRATAEEAVKVLLRLVGRDPDNDDGVRETPRRVVSALEQMCSGIYFKPEDILKTTFEVRQADQIIVLSGIAFDSLCEHHLLPFSGTVDIGYLPCERMIGPEEEPSSTGIYNVVGLSKLARLVDCFANRTQLQERMTQQIADSLQENLKPRGVAVVVRATHSCMSCRGVKKSNTTMVTSCMLGLFMTEYAARQEFLSLCRGER